MSANAKKTLTASSCISKYFLDAWGLDPGAELVTETVAPKTLLTANRFDLACKLYYIDCLEKGLDMSFAKELYKEHIEAFSDGAFIEPGLTAKNSIQDYFASFDRLIVDIKQNGFDPEKSVVPVGADGAILDGSHRTAIAIYYDIPISIVRIPGRTSGYDHEFFSKKGMSREQLDFMAYQYIRFSEQVYTVCLWPAAYDEGKLAEVEGLIKEHASVVYRKEAQINFHGMEKLMVSFYRSMPWIGSLDSGFSGVSSKARECYRENAPTTVYVICNAALESVLELKQRIRELYNIGNSSVHITDTHVEAVEAGKMLLNSNSIDFMNYGDPFRNVSFIKDFTHKAEARELNPDFDTTLALYGIRDKQACNSKEPVPVSESPFDHFYFWGAKLPALEHIKAVKERSGGTEDLADIRLIKAFEQIRRSRLTSVAARVDLAIKGTKTKISCFLADLHEEARRMVKVLYHRLKYKNQRVGKGEFNVEDLQAVFLNVNTTTAEYLIMRNWEDFYDDILLEGHNDIDLLCRDKDSRDIIVRLLDAKPLTFDGFHYSFKYRGRDVTLDTRLLGDGYYDRRWQRDMLKHRRLHPLGFCVMEPEDYYYSLIYHAVYQKKNGLTEEYAERLNQMAHNAVPMNEEGFAEQLDIFMKKHRYAYTETKDKSVVKAFSNTAIRKKMRHPLNVRVYHFTQEVKSMQLMHRLKILIRNLIVRG